MINISSRSNEIFKKIKKLKQKKYRDIEKQFLAEGDKFLNYEKNIVNYIINEEYYEKYKEKIDLDKLIILTKELFNEISSHENSQGVIIVYNYNYSNVNKFKNTVIVLDKIQDPGNIGTIIRTADAIGVHDFIMIKGTGDIYNEKTVRATMGSIFKINCVYFEEDEAVNNLINNNYNIIATTLSDKSINYDKMILSNKNAIIFGNEGNGISKFIQENSNYLIKIPIIGDAESLNVSVAAGVILYKYLNLYK